MSITVSVNVDINPNTAPLVMTAVKKGIEYGAIKVTKDSKGLCPVDTGNLRKSIRYEMIKEYVAEIGTNVKYAPYVEYGTKRMKEQMYLRPALYNNADYINRVIRNEIKKVTG